jgi:predicted MFS family arabinose efflux permease
MLVGEALTIIGCIVTAVAQNVPTLIAGETLIGMATGIIFVAYAGVPEMLPNKWRAVGLGILEAGIAIPW